MIDINKAIDLKPNHISFYQLTIEPNTLFAKFPPSLPKDEDIWQMGEQGVLLLEQYGFNRYEVSAFGKTSSKHNLNYWQFGDYIGIGAGAHGKITQINNKQNLSVIRTLKPKSPVGYIRNCEKNVYVVDSISFEFMLNALRLKNGFELELFSKRVGYSIDAIKDKLDTAVSKGLLVVDKNNIKPSTKGYDFLNDLQSNFL